MKKLRTIMVVFALILVISVVYAATDGSLELTGKVNLAESVKLEIEKTAEPSSDGGGTGSMIVATDGASADFVVNLLEPGETMTFTVLIRNTGSLSATIDTVTLDFDDSVLDVTIGTVLENKTITAGYTYGAFTILIQWIGTAADADTYDVSITIDYSQAD